MDPDAVFDRLQREIDDAIAPDNLSAADALQVLERIADYCDNMAKGIREDLNE